jgi:hypothetical protein
MHPEIAMALHTPHLPRTPRGPRHGEPADPSPDLLPVDPDPGPAQPGLLADPEHDRVLTPDD